MNIDIRIINLPDEVVLVEDLQRLVWPGNETEILPAHLMISAVHQGGVLIGAFTDTGSGIFTELVGFVFGFPGFYNTPDGPRLMHYSHMLGIHPEARDAGLGFSLKRAQWQIVRNQGIDRISWTYDPLQSRNANLNIAKLGSVCNTYYINYYGKMRDGLNLGIPSDRFLVDWWVNSKRVSRRLSWQARQQLGLAQYLAAGAQIVNPTGIRPDGLIFPSDVNLKIDNLSAEKFSNEDYPSVLLVEIPSDVNSLKSADINLCLDWRMHIREIFTYLFQHGYLVTDFVRLSGSNPRSLYVLSQGEKTL